VTEPVAKQRVTKPPIELFRRDTDAAVGYACGVCGTVHSGPPALESAERCCADRVCGDCGTVVPYKKHCMGFHDWVVLDNGERRGMCRECYRKIRDAEWRERDRKTLAAAKHITLTEYFEGDYKLYRDGSGGNEGFHFDSDSVIESIVNDEAPDYWWVCEETSLTLDARDILESATQDAWEGLEPDEEGLQEVLNKWLEGEKLIWWNAQHNTAVVPTEQELADVRAANEEQSETP